LHDIPQEERKLDPPPSAFTARRYPINKRSPYLLRRKNPKSHLSGSSTEDEPTGDEMTKVATLPRAPIRALKASIRRAREGVQAGESEETGNEAFNLRHQLESSDITVRKVVCSGWYRGLHSTIVAQTLHYTVEARRDVSICLTSSNSARWSSGSLR